MPFAVTDFGAAAWLATVFKLQDPPAQYWIALVDGEPGTDTDGTILADTEPDDPSYHRAPYPAGSTAWGVNGNFIGNLADLDFGVPAADWGYLDHFVLCTDEHDGEVYAYGELTFPQLVEADSAVLLPAGSMVLALIPVDDTIAI